MPLTKVWPTGSTERFDQVQQQDAVGDRRLRRVLHVAGGEAERLDPVAYELQQAGRDERLVTTRPGA